MKQKRSQYGTEFLMVICIIMFILVAALGIYSIKLKDMQKEVEYRYINETASYIELEINLAHNSSDGYYTSFYVIPLDVNISLAGGEVVLGNYGFPVNASGEIHYGWNNLSRKEGKVMINP